jgi:general secretion pathway protein J
MLVAISVASILIGLVYGTVRIGQRSASAAEASVEATEVMRIGWEFLQDAVRRARPMGNPNDDEDVTSFHGDPDALSFVADMPAYVGLGGLMTISIAVDRDRDSDRLLISRVRFDATGEDTPSEDAVQSAVLVDDLEHLEIDYFGQRSGDDMAVWQPDWREQPSLPNLVRIAIVPRESRAWPVMIASPSMVGPADEPEELILDEAAQREDH